MTQSRAHQGGLYHAHSSARPQCVTGIVLLVLHASCVLGMVGWGIASLWDTVSDPILQIAGQVIEVCGDTGSVVSERSNDDSISPPQSQSESSIESADMTRCCSVLAYALLLQSAVHMAL